MIKILFVCTGNVFRSLSAQKLLEAYLVDNKIKGFIIGSAGIRARPQQVEEVVIEALSTYGVDKNVLLDHKQTKVSKRILKTYDIIICMTQYQRKCILDTFGVNSQLYMDVLTRKNTNVWDEKDGGIVSRTPKQRTAFIHKTIRFLAVSTPTLFEKICSKYLLFDQFLKGKREGIDGLPYIELASNKNAVAFMSADIPKGKKYHVLVIARKKYTYFDEVPQHIQRDMMLLVSKIGKVFFSECDGYNVLINSGTAADQSINHVHIHIVPRNWNDGIKIELWKRKKVSKKDFVRFNNELKKLLK